MADTERLEAVEVATVRPLRSEVLRRGGPPEASVLPFDEDPRSRHLALLVDGEVVAVGSVLPEPPPWSPDRRDAWRVRGMATKEGLRSLGHGEKVLRGLIDYAASAGGRIVWCDARLAAVPFYGRQGFGATGGVFVKEGVDHLAMWREL
ncbi:MAG TPA: GNAT family N-acetyltransferase [Acidimicrobiia bacterium]|nr:GNAT family N-acetyltransferase [Acidimicrobiia bacterium]